MISKYSEIIEPPYQKTAYAKTKVQTSFAVTAKLISAFVCATGIEQFLYFLNPKFASSSHLWQHRQVGLCQTWSETQIVGFLTGRLDMFRLDQPHSIMLQ